MSIHNKEKQEGSVRGVALAALVAILAALGAYGMYLEGAIEKAGTDIVSL